MMDWDDMHGVGMGMGGTGMVWGMLFGLLLLAGLVVLIVVIVRYYGGGIRPGPGVPPVYGPPVYGPPTRGPGGTGRASDILAERYARGEIDTEEYHERLRHLGGS